MNNSPFGKTGLNLSKIGLGTVQFGVDYGYTKKKSQDEVNEILSIAAQSNINFLDTANEYGDSEKKIGHFIKQHESNFIIFTKLKKLIKEQCESQTSIRKAMEDSLNESLSNLGMSSLDFLLLHQADDYIISNHSIFDTFRFFKEQGFVRGVGVSVYDPGEVEYVLSNYGDLIDFFQIPYNIFDRRFDYLLDRLYSQRVGVICRSIYLKGLIPCDNSKVPSDLSKLIPYKNKLNQLAEEEHLTSKELALLYVLSDQRVSATILGVDTPDELIENIRIIENKKSGFHKECRMKELQIDDEYLIDPRRWNNF